ncbi:hypothetical protein KFE98_01735 [bacterium SCSIO 12741]|nr:hypothetical protein KFE98_01735 [bacterium SCSIO 12741]
MKFNPDRMILDYNNEVYEKVSQITGLKFKTHMKGSGVVFEKIFEMHNLISGKKHFLLLTNSNSIPFTNRDEFIQSFILWLKKSIAGLNNDHQQLNDEENQALVDENYIFIQKDRIAYSGEKQLKLLNKMRELRGEVPDVNKK